jgi:transcriptional regulator with XRE-family HTH domain
MFFFWWQKMDKEFKERFSKRVRGLRGKRSQGDFAKLLEVSQPTIVGWESGANLPNLENLEKLAGLANEYPEMFLAKLYGRESVDERSYIDITDAISAMSCVEVSAVTMAIANRLAKGEH